MARAASSAIAAAIVAFAPSGVSAGEGGAEQRWACQQDAFTFCRSEIPDVERVTACMAKNLERLSPRCRAQFKAAGKDA